MSTIAQDGFIETADGGPLCPFGGGPAMNDAHRLRGRLIDVAYGAADKNEDSEFIDQAAEKVYMAMAYGPRAGDRMNLYRATTLTRTGGIPVGVEALWFQCPVCGFVLPAQVIPR